MWFIGQFENGSWGFQQEGCLPRYTSKHEAETIRDMYEALKDAEVYISKDPTLNILHKRIKEALAKAEGD